MSVQDHRPLDHREACVSCKTRKKKCDKAVPTCSYCVLKHLDCRYTTPSRRRRQHRPTPSSTDTSGSPQLTTAAVPLERTYAEKRARRPTPPTVNVREAVHRPLFESLDGIHAQVQSLIRSTGRFIDDLTSHYFRNIHSHLPIISRACFQNTVIASGVTPGADHSALLLAICVLAYLPSDRRPDSRHLQLGSNLQGPGVTSRQSLYLAAKGLLAQVQGSLSPPTIPLVQANLLIAVYEYATGRPEIALVTVAGCARMGYSACLHDSTYDHGTNKGDVLETAEARNTWWSIVIYERVFTCDVPRALEQPLATAVPSGDARLPIEQVILDRGNPNSSLLDTATVSSISSTNVGGFGCAAQAACLLDRVTQAFNIPDINTRLFLLESLDTSTQAFLALAMERCRDLPEEYCCAIAIGVRLLFTLHNHIVNLSEDSHPVSASSRPLEEWRETSRAALDTVTTIVVDIAKCHYDIVVNQGWIDEAAPNHDYIVQAAIRHMQSLPGSNSDKEDLQRYLDRIRH